MKKIQKYSITIYIVIPIISVCLCRLLRIAQGEKNEEIVFGIMLGLALDLILCVVLWIFSKMKNK